MVGTMGGTQGRGNDGKPHDFGVFPRVPISGMASTERPV